MHVAYPISYTLPTLAEVNSRVVCVSVFFSYLSAASCSAAEIIRIGNKYLLITYSADAAL